MLTYRQLEDAGEAVVRLVSDTEQAIITDMARRIARLDGVTGATNWQALRLELLGTTRQQVTAELSKLLGVSEPRLIELFDEAATRALAADSKMYQAAGYSPVPLADNPQLQQVIRAGLLKTLGTYQNLTLTTANTATSQFESALDAAYQKIVSGGFTYQQAIKDGIRTLTQNGLASILYPTGHVDWLDVAFRRAVLTGVNQTCAEIQLENARQLGVNLFEVTAHASARPSHAVFQGKVFRWNG